MSLSVKHISFSNGERHKLLLNSRTGIPFFYPSLFITTQIRSIGHSVSTIQNTITAFKVLYAWQEYYNLDIETRFQEAKFLTQQEIISLRDYTKKPLNIENQSNKVQRLFSKKIGRMKAIKYRKGVATETTYNRITAIANYIRFLAITISYAHRLRDINDDIDDMLKLIKAHRPRKKTRAVIDRDEKGITSKVVDLIFEKIKPDNPVNPFRNSDIQLRNYLILSMLRYLGIRRGDLLNIRVEDIDFAANELKIVRRPDNKLDWRKNQPLVKTLERTLLISPLLAKQLSLKW